MDASGALPRVPVTRIPKSLYYSIPVDPSHIRGAQPPSAMVRSPISPAPWLCIPCHPTSSHIGVDFRGVHSKPSHIGVGLSVVPLNLRCFSRSASGSFVSFVVKRIGRGSQLQVCFG